MSWATESQLDQSLLSRWRADLREADGPLRDRLAQGVFTAVCHGEVRVGSRLPAERRLADALGVSRGTVVAAFDQLVERGIVERRPGSGSYVRSAPVTAASLSSPDDRLLVEFWMNHQTPVDLAISSPIDPPESLVSLPAEAGGLATAGEHGYSALGLGRMRRVAAERLCLQGVPTTPDDVMITCGAQQALQLAVRALVRSGDRVFVDSPTYPGLLAILRQAGARPIALRSDASGVLPGELARAVAEHGPAILATSTIVSNPDAAVLTEDRRAALLEVITAHDVVVIEDLTLADTILGDAERDEIAPATPLTADERVRGVTIGSASKVIWGGLRVGWLRTQETWLRRMAQAKALEDFGTSPVTQRLTADLMDELVRRPEWWQARQAELRARRDLLVDLIHEHLPSWGVRTPVGGLSLWVRVPGVDGAELAETADRYGVHVMPGDRCGLDGAYADHLRLCFDRDPQMLHEAVGRLTQAYAEVAQRPARQPAMVGP
jgi:DNA-binding transcriptional MocR family regulator